MKKYLFITLALLLLFAMPGNATSIKMEGKLVMRGDSLFLVDEIGECLVDPTEMIVKLREGQEIKNKELKVLRTDMMGYVSLAVPDGKYVQDFAEELDKSGEFEIICYNILGKLCSTSNDPYLPNQWYLSSINVFDAWNYTMGSPSVKIAVLDDYIPSHGDLHYSVADGYSNIDESLGNNYHDPYTMTGCHGLDVAYIISAKTNNGYLGAGIAGGDNCQGSIIVPFNVCDNYYGPPYVSSSMVCNAIYNAVSVGVKIINMSILFNTAGVNVPNLSTAINHAYNNGVTIIAGSGNSGSSSLGYPSSSTEVISVGSVTQNNIRSTFSSYGNNLDIMAHGEGITLPALQLNNTSGTSFAAPQVAGVAALMLSIDSSLSPSQIRRALVNTATKLSGYTFTDGYNSEVGYGKVNAKAAVELIAGVTQQTLDGLIVFTASDGHAGYWTSNYSMGYNSFYLLDSNTWKYDRIEARLYKLDNNYNPVQLIQSWNNISTTNAQIPGYTSGWYLFQLRGYNELGYTDWIEQEVEVIDVRGVNFLIEYDPSSDLLTITQNDPSSKSSSSGTYEIQIWNSISTQMIRNYKAELSTFQVSLAGLQKGIYIVRVIKDGQTFSKKIVKRD